MTLAGPPYPRVIPPYDRPSDSPEENTMTLATGPAPHAFHGVGDYGSAACRDCGLAKNARCHTTPTGTDNTEENTMTEPTTQADADLATIHDLMTGPGDGDVDTLTPAEQDARESRRSNDRLADQLAEVQRERDRMLLLIAEQRRLIEVNGSLARENSRLGGRVDELTEEKERLTRSLADARTQANAARQVLDTFKDTVRDKAIEVAEEHGWCDEGLNEVLEELGLAPKEREFTVTVRVTGTVEKAITVTAADEDAAKEIVENNEDDCVSDAIEDGSFEWDADDIAVENVDAA